MKISPEEVTSLIEEKIKSFNLEPSTDEVGYILQAGDGIARVSGLYGCKYGELLVFGDKHMGMALNLEEENIGCVILGQADSIYQGMTVKRTFSTLEVPVGDELLGRVVDPLGMPLDGKGPINATKKRPIESEAASVINRQPVNAPIETGIIAIDSMVPIGKGQRELIVGDRQTGKTSIAVDTIINQKNKDVICIYVAIGQKSSSVAKIVSSLEKHEAMDYTIVISSTASDMASLQYIAPYSGCAMAEEFMYAQNKNVLIIYDDLSKHAVAYRAMSLLLRRPPGREAYPGDVFYLHSRLLERAARLSDKIGGGSITALPIIETQAGDVSSYIPTNVISITDGQIFLESELFYAGQRPAINVGLSVSRVGGAAQCPAMKKVSGPLRIYLAQYRELAVFSQFGSDLDKVTQETLKQGERLIETLKQAQYSPYAVYEQVFLLYASTGKYLIDIPIKQVLAYNTGLLKYIDDNNKQIGVDIANTGILSAENELALKHAIKEYTATFKIEQKPETSTVCNISQEKK